MTALGFDGAQLLATVAAMTVDDAFDKRRRCGESADHGDSGFAR
jgi:hypothetical protein